jgi:glycosyltransferase involved in cell wall biosynthesis
VLDDPSPDLEVVVVDDGSIDGTPDLVARLVAEDPRVRAERLPENQGVSVARNHALTLARGTWLGFLDADDRLLPGAIAALRRPTVDPAVKVVVGQRIWTDGTDRWITPTYDRPDIRVPGRKSIATHPGLLSYASTTGRLVHRSMTEGLTFEGRVMGDQPWTIRAMLRAGSGIEVIEDVVYEWSRPPDGASGETITSATRTSTTKAVELARMAALAYTAVRAEAAVQVLDDALRHGVEVAYLDRIIRADLSVPLRQALERRDPAIGDYLAALADLLAGAPGPVLADSAALVSGLLRPPARAWGRLTPDGRVAYRQSLATVAAADPAVRRRILGPLGTPCLGARGGPLADAWLGLLDAVLGIIRPVRPWREVRRSVR